MSSLQFFQLIGSHRHFLGIHANEQFRGRQVGQQWLGILNPIDHQLQIIIALLDPAIEQYNHVFRKILDRWIQIGKD